MRPLRRQGFLDDDRARWGTEWSGLRGARRRRGPGRSGGRRARRAGHRGQPRTRGARGRACSRRAAAGDGRASDRGRGRGACDRRRHVRGAARGVARRRARRAAPASSTPRPWSSTTAARRLRARLARAPCWAGACASARARTSALGALVLPGLRVGAWTTLGAGAVMVESLPDGVDRRGRARARAAAARRAPAVAHLPLAAAPGRRRSGPWWRRRSPPTGSRRSGRTSTPSRREFAAATGARPRRGALLGHGGAAPGAAPVWASAGRRGALLDAHLRRPAPTRSSTRARRRSSSTRTRRAGTWTRRCSRSELDARARARAPAAGGGARPPLRPERRPRPDPGGVRRGTACR